MVTISNVKKPAALTKAQSDVLAEFRARAQAGKPPPSHRELQAIFGWGSPTASRKHIAALVRKGALQLDVGASRGAHIPEPLMRVVPYVEGIDPDGTPTSEGVLVALPIQCVAAEPAMAIEVQDNRAERYGVLRGDLVVVHRGGETGVGDLVVVAERGRPRIMAFDHAKRGHKLVLGVVTYLMRNYSRAQQPATRWPRES